MFSKTKGNKRKREEATPLEEIESVLSANEQQPKLQQTTPNKKVIDQCTKNYEKFFLNEQ